MSDDPFSPDEIASIEAGLEAVSQGLVAFSAPERAIEVLRQTWDTACELEVSVRETASMYPTTAPGWYVGWSPEFLKRTQNIDRKLQGRIYQAIAHISREPTTLQGNTVKPLTSGMKGLWRYRIGDFRLVYHPNSETRHITLITFAGRGDVYG